MNQAQRTITFDQPSEGIRFHIADGPEIHVDAFHIEETGYQSGQLSEDDITKNALIRCSALFPEHPDPHFLLHDVLPLDTFPDHSVSAKLSARGDSMSVVFHCDYRGEGIAELCEVYLGRMNWDVLVGIDADEVEQAERKWFGWMGDEPRFENENLKAKK